MSRVLGENLLTLRVHIVGPKCPARNASGEHSLKCKTTALTLE